MHTLKNKWDVERAAAWLRKHAWGEQGEDQPPPLEPAPTAEVAPAASTVTSPAPEPGDEIDIAGWPALVAPFYD
jgi:hypothetical protein